MTEPLNKQIERISRELNAISQRDVPRGISSATNKIARKIKTRVVRGVAKAEKLPNRVVNKKVFIKRSSANTLLAVIRAYRSDISVVSLLSAATVQRKLGTGTNRKGVTVRGRKFPGAFINTGPNGNPQVFKRLSRAQYPIDVVKIPIKDSVDSIAPRVAVRVARSDYLTEVRRELNFRLQKRLGKL